MFLADFSILCDSTLIFFTASQRVLINRFIPSTSFPISSFLPLDVKRFVRSPSPLFISFIIELSSLCAFLTGLIIVISVNAIINIPVTINKISKIRLILNEL